MGYLNKVMFLRYFKKLWEFDFMSQDLLLGFKCGVCIFMEDVISIAGFQYLIGFIEQFSLNFFGICCSVLSTAYTMKNSILFFK